MRGFFLLCFVAFAALLALTAPGASAHRVNGGVHLDDFPLLRLRPKSRNTPAANPLPPQPETCPECSHVANSMVAYLQNATNEADIQKALDGICTLFKKSDEQIICGLIVDIVARFVPDIVELIQHGLGWHIAPMLCNFVGMCKAYCCLDALIPEQLHLAYAHSNPTVNPDLNVRWIALYANTTYTLQWRKQGATTWTTASDYTTTNVDLESWVGAVFKSRMTGLESGTAYEYRVGGPGYWTDVVQFTTLPANAGTEARPLRFVQIGDMGWMTNFSGNTEHALTKLAQAGSIDFILHIGDISYANGDIAMWDVFCREIEPIASRIPYMTVPGNHEIPFNFTAYKRRFGDVMPRAGPNAPEDAMYFAMSLPPALGILMMNSESPIMTADIDPVQKAWAETQLTAYNANRSQFPFLSAMHHRPLYCTGWKDICNGGLTSAINVDILQEQVEAMYKDQKVDVVMVGHVHDYERTWPVYKDEVQGKSYANATAPFYIVNGAGGDHEGLNIPNTNPAWMAAVVREWGFLTVEVTPSLFSAKYVQANTGAVVDAWSIPK